MGTVVQYQEKFESLNNTVRRRPLEALIGAFVSGLKEELRLEVQALWPQSLAECFEATRMVDENYKRLQSSNRLWQENKGFS